LLDQNEELMKVKIYALEIGEQDELIVTLYVLLCTDKEEEITEF